MDTHKQMDSAQLPVMERGNKVNGIKTLSLVLNLTDALQLRTKATQRCGKLFRLVVPNVTMPRLVIINP